MAKKFLKLVENTITRYSNGGILTGDQVELGSKYKSIPDYKNLSDDIKQHVDELFANDGSEPPWSWAQNLFIRQAQGSRHF